MKMKTMRTFCRGLESVKVFVQGGGGTWVGMGLRLRGGQNDDGECRDVDFDVLLRGYDAIERAGFASEGAEEIECAAVSNRDPRRHSL